MSIFLGAAEIIGKVPEVTYCRLTFEKNIHRSRNIMKEFNAPLIDYHKNLLSSMMMITMIISASKWKVITRDDMLRREGNNINERTKSEIGTHPTL